MIEGKRIRMHRIRLEDANEEYLSWLNDEEVTKGLETVSKPYTMEMLQAYVSSILANPKGAWKFIMTDIATGEAIGTGKIHNISEKHGTCNLGLMIGNRNFWGKGYGNEAYDLLIGFAFRELKIRKIWEAANATNIPSMAMCKKAGFKEEGVLKEQVLSEGKYIDKILLGLFASDWQNK
jgi:[ribosomal protein S5]-alanine N-acetyltransferase